LHQNPLAMVVDINGWGTGCSTLWQLHLSVSATEGATGLSRFALKMAVKMVHACVCKSNNTSLISVYTVSQKNDTDVTHYTVSVKKKSPGDFLAFFPKRLGIFFQILHACYMFLSTLEYKFLFNYLQL